MPHFVLEYSANIKHELQLDSLFKALHDTALASGVFPLGGIRFRALCCDDYLIADADPDNAFVHLTAKIGHGRPLVTRQEVGKQMFDTLTGQLQDLYARRPLAISLEMTELNADLNFKQNNIHARINNDQNPAGKR